MDNLPESEGLAKSLQGLLNTWKENKKVEKKKQATKIQRKKAGKRLAKASLNWRAENHWKAEALVLFIDEVTCANCKRVWTTPRYNNVLIKYRNTLSHKPTFEYKPFLSDIALPKANLPKYTSFRKVKMACCDICFLSDFQTQSFDENQLELFPETSTGDF